MQQPAICLGDRLSQGGEVVECALAGTHFSAGKVVAVKGDKARCDLHLGLFDFIEGSGSIFEGGLAVVLQGHRLACGCHAIASSDLSLDAMA